jgi:hypothetical protein
MAESHRLGQPRLTMVSITSLRYLHRLVLLTFLVSVVSLTMSILTRGGL